MAFQSLGSATTRGTGDAYTCLNEEMCDEFLCSFLFHTLSATITMRFHSRSLFHSVLGVLMVIR